MKKNVHFIMLLLGVLFSQQLKAQTIVDDVISLQNAIASATEGEIIQFSSSFPTNLTSTINIVIAHTNSFIVDGNGKTITIGGNYRHFFISKTTSAGTFILRNMELKGLRTDSNGFSSGAGGGGVSISNGSKGVINFDHIYFNSIQNGALAFSSPDVNAIVRVTNSTFRNNNKGDHGGAIYYHGTGNLEVSDCSFDENYNSGYGYSGGAIVCFNHAGSVTIKRSLFINNVSGNWGGAIGVYSPQGTNSSVVIDSCYFEGNKVLIANGNGDGGAISVFGNAGQVTKFSLHNSTFYRNAASDDGGALFIQNYDTGAENYVVNCTMFENYGEDVNPATSSIFNIATCGGAIQLSLKTPATLENNTIVRNYTKSTYQRGGGIGFHAATVGAPVVTLKNNIILGNYILAGTNEVHNAHSNVGFKALLNPTVTQTGNIGYDNGTTLSANITLSNALGNSDPILWDHHATGKIGNPYEGGNAVYYRAIPTISIKPNDGVDVFGLADGQGVASSLDRDARNYLRDQAKPNIGSVEIRWAKFDANGGAWGSLSNLTYNGIVYYEKDGAGDVLDYYRVTYYKGKIPAPSINPSRAGHVFRYWALDSVHGAQWNELPLEVTANRTLYAIWRTGFIEFENDTICEPYKADLTNLSLKSGDLTGVTLSYYEDSLCTMPVFNPKAVGGGTYYIIGVNAVNQKDTTSVDIIENKKAQILLSQKRDTCFYTISVDSLVLSIHDPSDIIISGTGEWFIDKTKIDPATYVISYKDNGKFIYYQIDTECGIVRSNKIEIQFCEIDSWIQRPVLIPEVNGLKTNLPPGNHYVRGHDDFVFLMSPLPGYSLEGVIVKTNVPKWDNNNGVLLEQIAVDTVKVTILQVTEPLVLTIEGIVPTSNASVIPDMAIWTERGQLLVDVEKSTILSVYTISGSLYTRKYLNEGKSVLLLPAGFYIVSLDDKFYQKVLVK